MITNILFSISRDEIYGGWEVMKSVQGDLDNPAFFGGFATLADVRKWLRQHFGATMRKVGAGQYVAEATVA